MGIVKKNAGAYQGKCRPQLELPNLNSTNPCLYFFRRAIPKPI
jgi:hypothetical protein